MNLIDQHVTITKNENIVLFFFGRADATEAKQFNLVFLKKIVSLSFFYAQILIGNCRGQLRNVFLVF